MKLFRVKPKRWWSLKSWRNADLVEKYLNYVFQQEIKEKEVKDLFNVLMNQYKEGLTLFQIMDDETTWLRKIN